MAPPPLASQFTPAAPAGAIMITTKNTHRAYKYPLTHFGANFMKSTTIGLR